uniref:Large ribosomal subunit protein bL33c n=1 Tax=Bangiopsis subsimplex TaxID=139980 RepID=A0A1C9CCV5_9RHOD|nr:ribosomal protein L33 [Bangiopsis subsimplex]AOM66192.1 ribosomal protein L33 [Bangiopsis subsimplex]ARO90447.1 50S ribosomal protein L33 [Bangiopsis subsimplex]
MGKSKGIRLNITLECTSCRQYPEKQERKPGVFRYSSMKNRRNTPNRLELNKYCPNCNAHTTFKEIK